MQTTVEINPRESSFKDKALPIKMNTFVTAKEIKSLWSMRTTDTLEDAIQHLIDAVYDAVGQEFAFERAYVRKTVLQVSRGKLSIKNIQYIAQMCHTPHILGLMADVLKVDNLNHPSVDETAILIIVCRCIFDQAATRLPLNPFIPMCAGKTPYDAWRAKKLVEAFIESEHSAPNIVDTAGAGYDSEEQAKQFISNFPSSEVVLWDTEIWKTAVRGSESFGGITLTNEMVDRIKPMFWQYTLPFHVDCLNAFFLPQDLYQCIGFHIMPCTETEVSITIPEELMTKVPSVSDGLEGHAYVGDADNPEFCAAIKAAQEGPRFAARGVSLALIFLPFDTSRPPEIRFVRPVIVGDQITSSLRAYIFAGLEFLNLKYVAKKDTPITSQALKAAGHKKLARDVNKGTVKIPPIRTVHLRKAERREQTEDEKQRGRKFNCHFIVEAHWRNQYYSSTMTYKVIRIMAYMKGDENKPFKPSRPKVFKADR